MIFSKETGKMPWTNPCKKIQTRRENALNYYNAGIYNLKKYNLIHALRDFNTALYFEENNFKLYLMRGIVYSEKELFQEALADLSKSIELNNECFEAYKNRGYIYFRLKAFDKALQDWNRSASLNPEDGFVIRMRKIAKLQVAASSK